MSAHFRAQLKLAYTEAEELLSDDRQFPILPIPARNNQPDSVFLLTIRSCIQSLNDHVSDVQSVLTVLNDNSDRWMNLRTNMTGAERIQDSPLYDNFVIEYPFPSTISNLRKYLRTLRDQSRALEANLPAKAPNTQNAASPSLVHLPKTTLPTFSGDCTTYDFLEHI
ncbi:hypothetical protein niasHT_013827 [Heterodera trifolii]|uniref:Uncharacterized protein n=1 Tax=Heterodera trifolii TaxID=157864 RepID=A0ABD2KVF9_9BILA